MSHAERMLILGASARAAAWSALRAGIEPRCLDHFADRDLRELCPVDHVPIAEGAAGLERAALALPPSVLIYTGPMENHPERVERLSRTHRLLGSPAGVLRSVRDPFRVAGVLDGSGLEPAEVRHDPAGLPRDGTWLVKPLASGGGRSIWRWEPGTALPADACYFQKLVAGRSASALYLGRPGRSELIGVCRQLVGAPGSPFAYRGSIGPCEVSGRAWSRLALLGDVLVSAFSLAGLFGVDLILRDDGPCVVEVNPRYTASVEVLELALGRSLLAEHVSACLGDREGASGAATSVRRNPHPRVVGKAIVYASRDLVAPELAVHGSRARDPFAVPGLADVPCPGTRIAAGGPVLTVLATAEDVATCEARLEKQAGYWERCLF